MNKKAILLINLGSPNSPQKRDIRKFLSEFLNDPRVIDLPWLARKLLVNLIIVPFRASKSAKMYRQIWKKEGSPILLHGKKLVEKLNNLSDGSWDAFLAMRYQKPSIESVLSKIKVKKYSEIIILPLFPQYASSTNGSIIEECIRIIKKWPFMPEIKIINQFYDHQSYIDSWLSKIREYHINEFDHILFSYHGLPLNQVEMTHNDEPCEKHKCTQEINEQNKFCYQAQCYHNTRLIADNLGINNEQYTVAFQSRFGKNWLSPFADKVIEEKGKKGKKKILVFPFSFVADCLETELEIAKEYKELFISNGGNDLVMVSSLNSEDFWVNELKSIILDAKF